VAGSHETKDRSEYMFRGCTECVGIRMSLLNLPVSLPPPNTSYTYNMTTLQDQLETQRSSTMEFQTRESRVSPDGVVTERDVRTTKECNIEGECGHISSELEGLWYNHANPNVVQYQLQKTIRYTELEPQEMREPSAMVRLKRFHTRGGRAKRPSEHQMDGSRVH
jgi:hypothetical protein